jgi:hypothetical protein
MYNLTSAFPASKRVVPDDGLVILPRTHNIYCAGFLSPRSALVEDISPGSSLPESYCKR